MMRGRDRSEDGSHRRGGRWAARLPAIVWVALASAVVLAGCGESEEAGGAGAERTTLRAIMVGLERDMQRVAHGIWVEDFDTIQAAAGAIADHPTVTEQERRWIFGVLGEDAGGFRQADLYVHDTGLELEDAAARADMADVLEAYDRLVRGCVACHREYREPIQNARGVVPLER
ncbi:MAG: hypothetical protein ACOC8B_02640 [Gemmatimonadota bacterium]